MAPTYAGLRSDCLYLETEQTMNCGECLAERVEIVALNPDGSCPKCSAKYEPATTPARTPALKRGLGGKTRATRRPEYAEGVVWIALNDEPTDMDPESISGFISTLLVADLFGVDPLRVARDVVTARQLAAKTAKA